jgi:hypothetical protein
VTNDTLLTVATGGSFTFVTEIETSTVLLADLLNIPEQAGNDSKPEPLEPEYAACACGKQSVIAKVNAVCCSKFSEAVVVNWIADDRGSNQKQHGLHNKRYE